MGDFFFGLIATGVLLRGVGVLVFFVTVFVVFFGGVYVGLGIATYFGCSAVCLRADFFLSREIYFRLGGLSAHFST